MRIKIMMIIGLIGTIFQMGAQEIATEIIRKGVRTDTIYRTDTLHIREVITRDDVVHRTERVVRYYDNEPFEDGSVVNGQVFVEGTQVSGAGVQDTEVKKIETVSPGMNNAGGIPSQTVIENQENVTLLPPAGGHFMWIPDSMQTEVKSLLETGVVVREVISNKEEFAEVVDINEKVVFRGDTLKMILKDRNLGRYDRGLFNYLFIPKGIWQVGLTASYGEFSTSDLEILDLVSDIDFSGKLWSIKPYFQYFLKSNLSVGLRLSYTEGKANVGSFKVDIDEDMNFNLHDIMYKSNSYSASFTFSQYLGITRRGRFGVFNEVELALSGGNADFHRPFNGEMRKTHTNNFKAALNFSPGVCVYVMDQVSFNVSLGVFGLYIKNEKQKVDGVDLGRRTTSGANFRFNIFNINFGIAVNI